ncbi:MAG: putative lyase [Chthonomonadales bacterium]|nr:putative lyase [Chthonomonadales bacterium]
MVSIRHILLSGFLFTALVGLPNAQAQSPDNTREKRLRSDMALLARGNEEEQGTAIYDLAQLSLPPDQGVPLFRAHLQRRTHTMAEALLIAHSLEGLGIYGPRANAALPDMIRLLDEIGTVEGEAMYGGQTYWQLTNSLSKIAPNDPDVVAAFKRALERGIANPERLDNLTSNIAMALGNMGRAAHITAPLLTRALDLSPKSAGFLVPALSHMMPEAAVAVPTLIRTLELKQSTESVVEAVVDALGTIGPAAKSALPALNRTLKLSNPQVAAKTFAAIARVEGQPKLTLPESLTLLKQIDKRRIPALYAAFTTIQLQGTHSAAAPRILAQIVAHRKEKWLRRTAIDTLAEIGPQGDREAGVALIQAARGNDPVIALRVSKAFEKFGNTTEKVLPELGALLQESGEAGNSALGLLPALGPKVTPIVPALVQRLRLEANGQVAIASTYSLPSELGRIGPAAKAAVPVLTSLLLKPTKERAAKGAYFYSRTTLLTTLMQIGVTPEVLPVVREMLQSDQPTEVACAAHAVALLAPHANDTVPLLLRPLRPDYKDSAMTSGFFHGYSQDTSARIEAIRALAKIGPAAREALPLLRSFAETPEVAAVRSRFALPDLKQEAKQAIQAIR